LLPQKLDARKPIFRRLTKPVGQIIGLILE
jgi:hypothetical protein